MGRAAAAHSVTEIKQALGEHGFGDHEITSTFHFPPRLFWGGYKILRLESTRRTFVRAVLAVNRFFRAQGLCRTRGGELLIRTSLSGS